MAELIGVHVLVVEDTDGSRELRPMPSQNPAAATTNMEDARWTSPFLPVTTFAC